jgi:hypothetical protein
VTAAISNEQGRRDPFGFTSIAAMLIDSDSAVTNCDLELKLFAGTSAAQAEQERNK